MKSNTIKWRIFKYNLMVIILLISLVAVIFNLAVKLYIENEILGQLTKISSRIEHTALSKGPDFFPKPDSKMPIPLPREPKDENKKDVPNEYFGFYFMLDRSLRDPLSVLNADYLFLDNNNQIVSPFPGDYFNDSNDLRVQILNIVVNSKNFGSESYLNFSLGNDEYVAIIRPVSNKNNFGLGSIIIYSSIKKINQFQIAINLILFVILVISAIIIVLISSTISKKISSPFSSLNLHIREIAERNFKRKIHLSADDEFRELVSNINTMTEKLECYDKSQKVFLQNASHEFRTPLMSIQSYAEGIKYNVVDTETGVNIILEETKRMTHLVEDLLYLSRLDTIEENYNFVHLDLVELVNYCVERINVIALNNNIKISITNTNDRIDILGDEEKLSRAVTNILSNCIRYAKNSINIELKLSQNFVKVLIMDDGDGINSDELPNIFDRFYKGEKGIFGLGLSISKNVIEKHSGTVAAENTGNGALFTITLPIGVL